MNIAIYVGKNDEQRSQRIMAEDLCSRMEGSWIAAKIPDLKGADVVLNLVIDDVPKIEETRRYVGYGKQVCLFAGCASEFKFEQRIALLVWLHKIKIIVHSNWHYKYILEQLKVFSPAMQRDLKKNLILSLGGITDEFVCTEENRKSIWIVPCNRFAYTAKNTKLHMEVIAKVCATNVKVRNDFYMIASENLEELKTKYDLSWYNVHHCPIDRNEYVRNAQRAGMFLCTSIEESFGLMYLELLACGVVGVFLDVPWIRELLPGYRYLASKEDLPAMMLKVYKSYGVASNYVKSEVMPYVEQHYRFERFVNEVIEIVESCYE